MTTETTAQRALRAAAQTERRRRSNTALYKIYSDEFGLLYVGISCQPFERWKEHRGGKSWTLHADRIELQWFTNRADAEAAEIKAIKSLGPLYNRAHAESWRFGGTVRYPQERITIEVRTYVGPDISDRSMIEVEEARELLGMTTGETPGNSFKTRWLGGSPAGGWDHSRDANKQVGPWVLKRKDIDRLMSEALNVHRMTLPVIADAATFEGGRGCPGFIDIVVAAKMLKSAGAEITTTDLRCLSWGAERVGDDRREGDEDPRDWLIVSNERRYVSARRLRELLAKHAPQVTDVAA